MPTGLDMLMSAGAIVGAAETGILDALARGGAASASDLARDLGLDERATTRVLDVLEATGIVARHGHAYEGTHALLLLGTLGRPAASLMLHVPAFLRTGKPLMRMDGSSTEREHQYRDVVGALARMFENPACELAECLPPCGGRLLDVGAGSGVWSLAMLERDRDAHVVAADMPAVLQVFFQRAADMQLSHRASSIGGDIHTVDLGSGFARAVLANVLHLEPPDRARALMARTRAAMAPDADLVIVDAFADGSARAERRMGLAAYHLGLAQRTEHGRVYARAQVQRWCHEVGLKQARLVELKSMPVVQALVACA